MNIAHKIMDASEDQLRVYLTQGIYILHNADWGIVVTGMGLGILFDVFLKFPEPWMEPI